MAGRLICDAFNPALTANGKIDIGASLQFYENRTTTPQAIYTTPALNVTLDNPLTPDAAGRFPEIWGPNGAVYTVEWTPTGEAAITLDDIGTTADPNPSTVYYDMYRYLSEAPGDGAKVIGANIPRPLVLPEDLNDGIYPSIFTIGINPTATMTLTLYKNSLSIGTIAFSTSGVPTVTFPAAISFAAADKFKVLAQATADVTGADLELTFVFRAA